MGYNPDSFNFPTLAMVPGDTPQAMRERLSDDRAYARSRAIINALATPLERGEMRNPYPLPLTGGASHKVVADALRSVPDAFVPADVRRRCAR